MTKAFSPFVSVIVLTLLHPSLTVAEPCESVASLTLPNSAITLAQSISPGNFRLPAESSAASEQEFRNLPAFCRVAATLKPSPDSDIKMEVWMPASSWNGKFQAVGNGGWAGVISYPAMVDALRRGYAASSTDSGHVGNSARFALGHPEKLLDFGYRSQHEMAVKAKAIIDAYYGNSPKASYFNGCSLGGRQGITEAERYPADYDAVIAGASAIYNMQLHAARMAINALVHRTAGSYIPAAKYPLIHNAVLEACDALDGVKDGVLEDPTRCHFDPKALECKGADSDSCLTSAQVETARALYAPIKNPQTGAVLSPALLQPGTELNWAVLAGPEPQINALESFKYLVFKDPNWDWHGFDIATDFALAVKSDDDILGLTDPDLKPFFNRGGKLLMYHGWADPQVAAMNSVTYFNDVVKTVGKAAIGKSIQLYMVPGMNHCRGGPGTDTFDKVGALEQWVEKGKAPERIIASHLTDGKPDRTRPLCPYPQVAKYKGSGSTDDAANFVCAIEK